MTDPRTILVVGATGAQGGSVVRHLAGSPAWRPVLLTRDRTSARAQALAALGAEVVEGDLTDGSAVRRAVAGADALFLVTDYWSLGADAEFELGRSVAETALEAGVRHVVHSSLPDTTGPSDGAITVPHHEGKARLDAHLRSLGAPLIVVHPATYYENWPARRLRPDPSQPGRGALVFSLPHHDVPLPALAIEDLGGVVAAVLERPEEFHGRTVGVVGDIRPCAEYADILARHLQVPVRYQHVPADAYARLPVPGAAELALMWDYSARFQPDRGHELVESRRLFPGIRTFDAWVAANLMGAPNP